MSERIEEIKKQLGIKIEVEGIYNDDPLPKLTPKQGAKDNMQTDMLARMVARSELGQFIPEGKDPDENQLLCAKMSLMFLFDGKHKTALEVAGYPSTFLQIVALELGAYQTKANLKKSESS